MQINQYSVYSVLSESEEKNMGELEEVLQLIKKLESVSSIDTAKEFLEKTWKVNGAVKRCTIAPSCLLETKDTENMFIVKFACPEQDLTYYYKK